MINISNNKSDITDPLRVPLDNVDCPASEISGKDCSDNNDFDGKSEALFRHNARSLYVHTDRTFAVLMFLQWIGGIIVSVVVSPHTWIGATSSTHPHIMMAVFGGALIASLPIVLAVMRPGCLHTRIVISISQTLFSCLLIHLSGGRIETHFHVFGSLAFLAVYRDWRVLLSATTIVTVDHVVRGLWWPESVFGVATASKWLWMEHAAWVLFEVVFLMITIRHSLREMKQLASHSVQLESALLTAKESQARAEKSSQVKSEFLATMSHELRTPLNGVIGMMELLRGTDINTKQRQYVDACRDSGESLLQLINDILDFTKIAAGKLKLDLHDFDLEKLVTDTVDAMAWRIADKDLEMPCYVDQVSRLVLKGDSHRLRQVLVNLLNNAIKFTEAGEVVVKTKIVARQDDRVTMRFSIADTGIGIPDEKLDRLFQPFSQVDASATRNYGGSGLGLVISQSLVELFGGTIGVDSKEGVGSTFWFEVTFDVVSDSTEDTPETSPLEGLRALIVDDNETNRMILAEYTSGWGLVSIATASVDEALTAVDRAQFDGSPFHIVLADYNMPERDGLDLARALTDHAQLFVLLPGSTDIDLNFDQMREHGIDAILRKPLRRQELYDVLCTAIAEADENNSSQECQPLITSDIARLTGHVLLAEDNNINQLYMTELMKQLGCTCDTATNGLEAVQAVQHRNYDLVLMDCQMPEVDGFEATRRIREMEAGGTLIGHQRIVALTANAAKGDRERCIDAGMDEYLSKPVQNEQVMSMFARFLGEADEPTKTATVATNDEQADGELAAAPIDAESLLARCFGNLEFAESLLDELESTGIQRVEEIRQCVERKNVDGAADAAHALKGAAGILCADTVQDLAAEIEKAGRSSSIETVEAELDELVAEMQQCLNYLPQLRQELKHLKEGA